MLIGVLAIQGAFIEHIQVLNGLGAQTNEIRQLSDLNREYDGFVLPGGESTAIGKLLVDLGLLNPLKEQIANGVPVFGTCAGMILLARKISNDQTVHIGTMDITVVRNAYGRQLGSFNTVARFGDNPSVEMPFIRAPYISECGENVQVLATVDGKIVGARQGNQLVTAFHPELSDNTYIHEYFLNMIRKRA